MTEYLPFLEIFLGIMGLGLSIMFCTTFCKACSRFREEHAEREAQWRHSEQEGQPPSIYFIPFPGSISQDSENIHRVPRYSQEIQPPPRYSTTVYCGPPPAYNELGFKPEDLPPAYAEYTAPPPTPPPPPPLPPHMVQPQTQSQQ